MCHTVTVASHWCAPSPAMPPPGFGAGGNALRPPHSHWPQERAAPKTETGLCPARAPMKFSAKSVAGAGDKRPSCASRSALLLRDKRHTPQTRCECKARTSQPRLVHRLRSFEAAPGAEVWSPMSARGPLWEAFRALQRPPPPQARGAELRTRPWVISERWPLWVSSFKVITLKWSRQGPAFYLVMKENKAYFFTATPLPVGSGIHPDFLLKMVDWSISVLLSFLKNNTNYRERGVLMADETRKSLCLQITDTMKPELEGRNVLTVYSCLLLGPPSTYPFLKVIATILLVEC